MLVTAEKEEAVTGKRKEKEHLDRSYGKKESKLKK